MALDSNIMLIRATEYAVLQLLKRDIVLFCVDKQTMQDSPMIMTASVCQIFNTAARKFGIFWF